MRVPGSDEAVSRLRATPGAKVGRGATADEVADAERKLVVRFPDGYRAFVEAVGWARAGDLSLFGLGRDVPEELDVRRASPKGSLVVARDGKNTYCLDLGYEGAYDSPVYSCTPAGAFTPEDYAAHDYPSWLWMRLERMR
ncbi:MAG TPA: SMI1/KNR4 family protein [Actinomycetota bacterium]|nr:SMI1/KNR4 family protein [Actinomycetota bacterium]